MWFDWDPMWDVWQNVHYFKGLDRHLPAANVSRPVPAVTGACMMIDRELYETLGGFPHIYVQGGFEDSHLCLELLSQGRQNWYVPEVELYHLEAQSYLLNEHRMRISTYNAWLQTKLCGEQIEALQEDS
jgi:GT2 family glycosyltransferase